MFLPTVEFTSALYGLATFDPRFSQDNENIFCYRIQTYSKYNMLFKIYSVGLNTVHTIGNLTRKHVLETFTFW